MQELKKLKYSITTHRSVIKNDIMDYSNFGWSLKEENTIGRKKDTVEVILSRNLTLDVLSMITKFEQTFESTKSDYLNVLKKYEKVKDKKSLFNSKKKKLEKQLNELKNNLDKLKNDADNIILVNS